MQALALISGLSAGWMGLGVVSAGAVVVAHLHARASGRAVWLPTARFLVPSESERKWPRRVREVLLLLTRCCCVLLLAMMFDRPSVPSGAVPAWLSPSLPEAAAEGGASAETAIVIVLDISDSMGVSEQGRTRLERGLDAARALIDGAESQGRLASVVLAGHTPRPVSLRATDRYDALREALGGVPGTREHADLDAAIGAAERLAASGSSGGVEIVVITDGQASAWKDPPTELGRSSTLRIVRAARGVMPVGLHAHTVATDRQRIDAGESVRAVGVVRNTGDSSREATVVWTLARGHEVVSEIRQRLAVPADGQSEASLEIRAGGPGVYAVSLAVEGVERSPSHALFVVQPEPRVGVLVADAAVRAIAMAAADPFGTGRARLIDPLSAEAPNELVGLDGVVIVGAGLLPEDVLDAVARQVLTSGTGLLHFVDSEGAVATAGALAERLPSLYPVEPEGRFVTRERTDPGFADTVPIDDPPRPLPDGSLTVGWFNLEVRRHAPAGVSESGQAVIEMADGSVLLASSTLSSPVVLAVMTGIDRSSSDLSIAPELPILVDALVRSTRAAAGGSDPEVRNAVGDVGDRVRSVGERTGGMGGPVVGPTIEPGVVVVEDERAGRSVAAFSVNPLEYDTAAADLEQVIRERTGRSGGGDGNGMGAVLESEAVVSRQTARVEVWPVLLALAVASLALEAILLVVGRVRRGVL